MPKFKTLAGLALIGALGGYQVDCSFSFNTGASDDKDKPAEVPEIYQLPEATVKPDTFRPERI